MVFSEFTGAIKKIILLKDEKADLLYQMDDELPGGVDSYFLQTSEKYQSVLRFAFGGYHSHQC
jgi:hypothetical protein